MTQAKAQTIRLYEKLKLVCFSLGMTAEQKDGVWKKKPIYTRGWKKIIKTDIAPNENAFALRTGRDFGITAIDIDNPDLETSQELMELMRDCNMIQKTRKGYHYVYKYDARLKQTTEQQNLDLDIRNDGGIIFCEPTNVKAPTGEQVASYEWVVTPLEDEQIQPIPEQVIERLKKLDNRYVLEKPQKTEEVADDVQVLEDNNSAITTASDPPRGAEDALLKILNCLSLKRLDNYDDWTTIGMICFNEQIPLEVWDTISKKSSKYSVGACKEKWTTFSKERKTRLLSQATLWKWLKQDDPITFYSLLEKREDFWTLINLLNHKDIAKYFYNINPDAYVYNEFMGWYSLTPQNIWKQSEKNQPSALKRHISDTLQNLVVDIRKTELIRYERESATIKDHDKQKQELKKHTEALKTCNNAYKILGSSEFCNGVISFLPSFYEVEDLEEKMDMNSYLFAFNDAVFDLKTCSFRAILPSDYISITTGYNYPKTPNEETNKEIREHLRGMFEDDETVNYLLNVLASCVFGGNRWEEFYVFTGTGGNGKGVIDTLLKNAFGNYYYSVDTSLFTKPVERKDQPIPALVEARNKRIMMTTEPESDDKLQVGLLKKISGNDPVEARTLNSKHIWKCIAQYKTIIQANNIPKLSKVDKAVERRMRIIQFPFNFVAVPTEPHHRVGNPDVKEKLCKSEQWRDEFMLMLTEIYKKIKDLPALTQPTTVKNKTNEYFDDNNPLKNWLDKYYTITKKETDKIQASELKKQFLQDTGTEKFSDVSFKNLLGFNGILQKKQKDSNYYIGIIRNID